MFRYDSAYRQSGWDYGRANIDYSFGNLWVFNRNNGNCASFSQKVWNDIMTETGDNNSKVWDGWTADIPGAIWSRI